MGDGLRANRMIGATSGSSVRSPPQKALDLVGGVVLGVERALDRLYSVLTPTSAKYFTIVCARPRPGRRSGPPSIVKLSVPLPSFQSRKPSASFLS